MRKLLVVWSTLLVWVLSPLLGMPGARAQVDNLNALLSGPDASPPTLKARDLTAAWNIMRTQTPMQVLMWQQILHRDPDRWTGVYFTQGRHLKLGDQEYLVAYQPQKEVEKNPLNRRAARIAAANRDQEPAQLKLPEDAELTLSLLHVKEMGSLYDLRAFDPQNDLLTVEEIKREEERQVATFSRNNLKQISLGLMQYVQDYDEKLPIMRGAKSEAEVQNTNITNPARATVQQVLHPYLKSTEIFVHPITRRPYLANPTLSGRNISNTQQPPNRIVTFYEDAADAEGKRAVAFLDGHVERVDKNKWERLRKSSHIPP